MFRIITVKYQFTQAVSDDVTHKLTIGGLTIRPTIDRRQLGKHEQLHNVSPFCLITAVIDKLNSLGIKKV